MKYQKIMAIGGVSVLLALGGCATTASGPAIDHQKLDALVQGKSTRVDAEAALGAPNGAQASPDGSSQTVYTHTTTDNSFIPLSSHSSFTYEECRLNWDARGLYRGSACNSTASSPSTR